MFTNDFARYIDAFTEVLDEVVTGGDAVDDVARAGVTHLTDVVVPTLATKTEVIQAAGGGIPQDMADLRYAPITGSEVYATQADVSGKANATDVANALAGKSDTTHTHTGVYQPAGSYATTTDLTTGLAGKADASHTHTGVYQPAGSYATTTDLTTGLAGKADASHTHTGLPTAILTAATGTETDTQVNSALYSKNTYFAKNSVSTSGTVNSNTLVYSTARANALFAPISGSANYAAAAHTHTGLPSAILTTAAPSGASDTNVYSALECDARFASTAGAGITQTQADARYLQLTGVVSTPSISTSETFSCAYVNGNFAPSTGSTAYAGANHTHTGVYQPAGSYATTTDLTTGLAGKSDISHTHATLPTAILTAATGTETNTEVNSALLTKTQLAAKANTSDVYTKTQSDAAYQTKANMTGNGTTYYSSAKCDTDFFLKADILSSTSGSTGNKVWSALLTSNQLANKSDTSHTHATLPTAILTAATGTESHTEVNSALLTKTQLAAKANTSDVYTKTQSDAAYQTKASMLTVGAETTYPSKAYADTLYAPIAGGGGSAPKYLKMTHSGQSIPWGMTTLTPLVKDTTASTSTLTVDTQVVYNGTGKNLLVIATWRATWPTYGVAAGDRQLDMCMCSSVTLGAWTGSAYQRNQVNSNTTPGNNTKIAQMGLPQDGDTSGWTIGYGRTPILTANFLFPSGYWMGFNLGSQATTTPSSVMEWVIFEL
jgi:hypothetical protein